MSAPDTENVPTTAKEQDLSLKEQEQNSGTIDETLTGSGKKDDVDIIQQAPVSRTLALIKPDAMQANRKDEIINKIKENGFNIVQEQQLLLSKEKAGLFYKEHEGKEFYQDLTNWMSSAPIYALILEKQDAVQSWRSLMGPTNSNKARDVEPNSIRALFGTDGSKNATHGSDSQTSAEREIALIFNADNSNENSETHVVQVQGLVDEVDTHDVCKPDAIFEAQKEQQLPEDINESNIDDNDTKNATAEENNEKTVEDIEPLHTADLVTLQDDVTDLTEQDETETEAINHAINDEKNNATREIQREKTNVQEEKETEAIAVVSLEAKIDATLQETTTNVSTSDSDSSDATHQQAEQHSGSDIIVPKAETEQEKHTEPIEIAPVAEEQDAHLKSKETLIEASVKLIETDVVVADAAESKPEAFLNNTELKVDTEKETDVAEIKNDTEKEVDVTEIESGTEKETSVTEIEHNSEKNKSDIIAEVKSSVKPEGVVETMTIPEVEEEPTEEVHVRRAENLHENEADLEPAAVVTENTLETKPISTLETAQILNVEEPVENSSNADQPTIVASIIIDEINENTTADVAGIVSTATVTATIEDTSETGTTLNVTSDVVPEETEKQTDVIVDNVNATEEKNILEDEAEVNIKVKLQESVIQENELEEGDPISTTPTISTATSSNGSSSQTSKNSSVTEKNQVKERIKETNVNKQPKSKAPGAVPAGIRSGTRLASSGVAAATATDKKKATSTGIRKPTSTLKKPTAADAEMEKPKTKTRVPRVALLSQPKKKPVQQDEPAAEAKAKKATVSTRSLVSRLTAPTAASARKKTPMTADSNTASAKPADAVRPKKASLTAPTATIKKTPSSASGATTAAAGTRASRASAATTKPSIPSSAAVKKPTTTTGVRRTLPATSATAIKKVDGTVKRTTTGTRATASGLPSAANGKTNTRKETLSTGSKLHKTAPSSIAKKPKAKKVDEAVTASTASSVSSAEAQVPSSSSSDIPAVSDEPKTAKSETVEAEKSENQVQVLDNDSTDQQEIHQQEIETDVIVSSDNAPEAIDSTPKQETNNEQEVESVGIVTQHNEPVVIVEPTVLANEASDAEVAAITKLPVVTETKKPQMASLRSRFENNNNNNNNTINNTLNNNQLHTTPSKEIRSKSPNRISDMINRFQ